MICSSCRRNLLSRLPSKTPSRTVHIRQSSSAPSTSPSPRQPSSDSSTQSAETTPSAISSNSPGLSQPLSTPTLPSTSSASRPANPKQPKTQKLTSSIPGGTPLYGLAYLKGKPTVLAKEDDEYPDWLWTLLGPESGGAKIGDGKSSADVAALPRAAREKYLKKQEKLLKSLPKTIPLHEQSKDLTQPGDSAQVSMQRRQELVRSSRDARRKAIKEENFLRSM